MWCVLLGLLIVGAGPALSSTVIGHEDNVQAAINAAARVGADNHVILKAGVYNIDKIFVKSNVVLEGETCGGDVIFVQKGIVASGFFYVSGADNVKIKNIRLISEWFFENDNCIPWESNNCGVGQMRGVFVRNSTNVELHGVEVNGFFKGIFVENSKYIIINACTSMYNFMVGVEIKYSDTVEIGSGSEELKTTLKCVNAGTEYWNWLEKNSGLGGLYVNGAQNVRVEKLYAANHGWDGIAIRDTEHAIVTQCFVSNNHRHGINVFGYAGNYSSDVIVSHNELHDNYNGVILQYVSDVTIQDNVIIGNTAKAIGVGTDSCNIDLVSNIIGQGVYGVLIGRSIVDDYKIQNIRVVGNYIRC